MRQAGWQRVKAVVAAALMAVSLTGCTIPIINVEIPFDLPKINLPSIDASKLDIKPITLPIGVRTSVADARAAQLRSKASTLDSSAVIAPGYLTVGVKTAASSAPLCVEGEGGRVYGLDVDLAAALASEMGLKVRYVPVVDQQSLGTDCDIIMDDKTEDASKVLIAGNYVESATSFFYRGAVTVLDVTDLNGKSVGLQSGSVSETVLNRTGLKMSQKSYVNLNEAFDALSAGEVDFVLCEAFPGAYLASLREGVAFAGALETPETSGIAVLASNAALSSAVQAAYDNISYNGIFELVRGRWVGSLPVLSADEVIPDIPKGDSKASKTSPESSDGASDGSEAGSNAITSV